LRTEVDFRQRTLLKLNRRRRVAVPPAQSVRGREGFELAGEQVAVAEENCLRCGGGGGAQRELRGGDEK